MTGPKRRRFFLPRAWPAWWIWAVVLWCACRGAQACPFCQSLGPTWTQRRESAAVVGLAQVQRRGPRRVHLRWLHRLKGESGPEQFQLPGSAVAAQGPPMVLVFGWEEPERWEVLPSDELSYAYLARAPGTRRPWPQRLRYFLRYLEHPHPGVAADAYAEFAQAPFEAVAQVAGQLPAQRLKRWLLDQQVPSARKGLYALLLALGAQGPEQRRSRSRFLQQLLQQPPDGFRAGVDGYLGAYVLVSGPGGLHWLQTHWLPRRGEDPAMLRHLLRALEVLHQYGPKELRPGMAQVVRTLLHRQSVARQAVRTLARWEDWDALPLVARLWSRTSAEQEGLRRWIVAYLLLCPRQEAKQLLAQISRQEPTLVDQVRRGLARLSLER